MKANELRVGNWVRQLQTGRFDQIDLFMFGEIGMDETYLDHLFPIPITPEILGKCGFKFDGDWNYQKGNLILHDMTDTDIRCFEVYWQYPKDVMVVGNFLTIQHLHQLQNLYFALTGEELAINL